VVIEVSLYSHLLAIATINQLKTLLYANRVKRVLFFGKLSVGPAINRYRIGN